MTRSLETDVLCEKALQMETISSSLFEKFLDAKHRPRLEPVLERYLLDPIRDLIRRPSKQIRRELVALGHQLGSRRVLPTRDLEGRLELAQELVEALHAGSLIVDDIEDNSKVRRGRPSIHCLYGLPIALNSANWLYFWPLQLIEELRLPPEKELCFYRVFTKTLLRAHLGQAIDLGVKIDLTAKKDVKDVCLIAMELKTGALTALALLAGGILGNLSSEGIAALELFGRGFGVALQMFDDVGNLNRTNGDKQFEDLMLRRPSWVWACASQYPEACYEEFVAAVHRLPNIRFLEAWLRRTEFVRTARERAHEHLERIYVELENSRGLPGVDKNSLAGVKELTSRLERAYG